MKRLVCGLVACLTLAGLFIGCTQTNQNERPGDSESDVVEPVLREDIDSAMAAVGEMLELDLMALTVSEFNTAVQDISTAHGMTFFEVLSNAFEDYENLDLQHYRFMKTTLGNSAQELFGEPVYMTGVTYMTTDDLDAVDLLEYKETMEPEEYDAWFDRHLGDIHTFVDISYHIFYEIEDNTVTTVLERDGKILTLCMEFDGFVASLSEEEITSPDVVDKLEAKLEELTGKYSNNGMRFWSELPYVSNLES